MAVDPGDDTDPEDPQSWNKFVYVRNNPLQFVDPTGKAPQAALAARRGGATLASAYGPPGPTALAIESGAKAVSALAGMSAYQAGAMALVLGGLGIEPAAAAEGTIAALSGVVKVGADVVAAMANPGSPENQEALKVGAAELVISGAAGKVAKSVGASKPVVQGTEAVTGAVVGAAARPPSPTAQQTPSSGGDDTSVDRAIADKEARAAKGPEPKKKK